MSGRGRFAVVCALLLGAAAPAAGEIYRWRDEAGREHFAQDLSRVPPRHRAQAEARAAAGSDRSSAVQTFSRPASPAAAARADAADVPEVHRIRVARAGTSMLVEVRLNGSVTAPFLIDTGATDVLVPQAVADQLGIAIGPGTRTKRYSTANGSVEHPVVMLRSVALGSAVVENVPASVSPNMSVGLLGLSFFNHFTYNVDAAAGVVTLRRNALAESGGIRGGRSRAQWRAEYYNLAVRIERIEREHETKSTAKTRERRRLEEERADLERQLAILDEEADQARVPMSWRH